MALWFTSDTHFGHQNSKGTGIIDYCNRPYASIEEMDEALVQNWNTVVRPGDTVYHLGDLSFRNFDGTAALVRRLVGKKKLIWGNHDFGKFTFAQVRALDFEPQGWSAEVALGHRVLKMSHFPYRLNGGGQPPLNNRRLEDTGHWLLHGHKHNVWRVNGRQINVGVDVQGFAPVHEDQILQIIRRNS